jgi:tRNA1(Val) A37 N6-methylase TrmN6
MVGMQVWRSALLMGDFILENKDIFTNDQIILELGSGVGLTGILAAMYCKEVIFTGKPGYYTILIDDYDL